MRILYISSANGMGGGSVALLNIICEMMKRGHEGITYILEAGIRYSFYHDYFTCFGQT